ncbi:rhomboid family intramembrane serine protease [Rhizobiales bacterium]|uniref:rhomboid family intramembrane serine protease n=1 Tax=Hongsoonwoonella zoysiae TaxID=2821844 RepID=UPI001561A0D1|nr:rhomboid family intramembrane serine protease [Hongsoonwoonella zoysiae]NRG18122.1 rhomboid family intramembrane serine protease [Hongsoonwoonella zoysiae]
MSEQEPQPPLPPRDEPALNIPSVVAVLSLVLIIVHVFRVYALGYDGETYFLLLFAFLPIRYAQDALGGQVLPGGELADIWTFLSYAFLHGGGMHLFINLLWMVVFGSALARRFHAGRFLVFSALCAIGGAIAHLTTHFGEAVPMVGASAAISGQMAGASRFVFEMGGPLGVIRRTDEAAYRVPATGLVHSLANRQVLAFLGVWFAINILFGFWSAPIAGAGASIAWEAHIGGFLAGLALFPLFDPIPRRGA